MGLARSKSEILIFQISTLVNAKEVDKSRLTLHRNNLRLADINCTLQVTRRQWVEIEASQNACQILPHLLDRQISTIP